MKHRLKVQMVAGVGVILLAWLVWPVPWSLGLNEHSWTQIVSKNDLIFIPDPEENDPEWSRGRILFDGFTLRYQLDFPYSVRAARGVEGQFRDWKSIKSADGLACAFGRVADVSFWIQGTSAVSQETVHTVSDQLIQNLLTTSDGREITTTPRACSFFRDY